MVQAYIDRIDSVNKLVNAVVFVRFEQALEEARNLDSRIEAALRSPKTNTDNVLDLPLLGVPFTIKESIAVKGMPLTAGLYSRKDYRCEEDATTVKNLKECGAVILGKAYIVFPCTKILFGLISTGVTNIPELLLWWDSNNQVYGRACNPYDLSRISGGSSGGEGAILGSAGSVVGLGSDIGGSIRIPAYFCGVFGHKPSSNIMPIDGVYPYCGHPDREKYFVIGPLCRYAVDLKLVLKQIIFKDTVLTAQLDLDKPVDLRKTKFYFMLNDGDPLKTQVCKQVVDAMKRARNFLENQCGYSCFDAHLPLMRYDFWIWLTSMSDVDKAPKLAEVVVDNNGQMNGFKEMFKAIFGQSHFRKITIMNIILEQLFHSENTRDSTIFRKQVERGVTLKSQLEALLGKRIF